MRVNDKHYETIWLKEGDSGTVQIIDQRFLPFKFQIEDINNVQQMFIAIRDMHLRGAPLIGAAAAMGMYLATLANEDNISPPYFKEVASYLRSSRPTAVNMEFAVMEMLDTILVCNTLHEMQQNAFTRASEIIAMEREYSRQIGMHGLHLIKKISKEKNGETVNILTHCNAGWLACIDYGTATAPIYFAHDQGIKVHVWVDETRPRNQGARLTAWELQQHGVPSTVIVDNTGGHLMQHKMVDLVIVGSDRMTITGDVANKIGTYLKALAAQDNGIPFYVALPSSSIDWDLTDGKRQIPIEMRDDKEVRYVEGLNNHTLLSVDILPKGSKTANYGFDVTPARLVTGLITERGICLPNKEDLLKMFPEKSKMTN